MSLATKTMILPDKYLLLSRWYSIGLTITAINETISFMEALGCKEITLMRPGGNDQSGKMKYAEHNECDHNYQIV